MAGAIMLQGTSSDVGKSVLATALCRILYQDGLRVAPFKSQNMALNSFVTRDGGEMGRAQAVQAEAAGLAPQVEMNPVLLKPTGNASSQVVLLGRPVGSFGAGQYHLEYAPRAWAIIRQSLAALQEQYDVIVIEGAGSPAEVNLKATDIANMRVAALANAPVVLIADIDRGGALAAIVGTLALLEPEECDRVKGIIINKFRGDRDLLQPALDFLEDYTGKPVLGVVPYFRDLQIQEEDSMALAIANFRPAGELLDVAVIRLPRMANFADFAALTAEGAAQVRYVENAGQLGEPDLVILPGTENIRADLKWLRAAGLDQGISQLADQGRLVWGIAGGSALLGGQIRDEAAGENPAPIAGLGLLDMVTVLEKGTATGPVTAEICGEGPFLGPLHGLPVEGYLVGRGQSVVRANTACFCFIRQQGDKPVHRPDGAAGRNGLVVGSALYGVFDNDRLRHRLFNFLRARRGWTPVDFPAGKSLAERRNQDYNRLAAVVRESLRMDLLYALIGGKRD